MPPPSRRRVAGTWYRYVRSGTPILGKPSHPADGRWQRSVTVVGFYLADTADTATAEWYRSLAERGFPPKAGLPRDLWRVDVDAEVADLSTVQQLADQGLQPLTPDSLTWGPYQDVGDRLFAEGWDGLVAPSAARPSGLTLCLFWRFATLLGVQPLPPPERWDEPPPLPRGMTT